MVKENVDPTEFEKAISFMKEENSQSLFAACQNGKEKRICQN